jgi:hypothetical protein
MYKWPLIISTALLLIFFFVMFIALYKILVITIVIACSAGALWITFRVVVPMLEWGNKTYHKFK